MRLVGVPDLMTANRAEEGDPTLIVLLPQSGHPAAPTAALAQGLRGRLVHGLQQASAVAPSEVPMQKETGDADNDEHHRRRRPAQAEPEVVDEQTRNEHRSEPQRVALTCSALLGDGVGPRARLQAISANRE
jgi:hypothetical protein